LRGDPRDLHPIIKETIMNAGIIRRMAETVLGPLVFSRRLPQRSGGGLIRVCPRAGGLKYLLKSSDRWDPELLDIAAALVSRNDSVWDVGSNVGLFSKAAAFHAGAQGNVLSIEADLDVVALLHATARRSSENEARMTVLPVAVADRQGVLSFAIARRARAANAIEGYGSTQTGGVREVRTLPCMTLDSLLSHFPAPNVLKIDVEGAEILVLNGATQILEQARPRVYCEVSTNTREQVCELLEGFGYRVWEGHGYGHGTNEQVTQATSNIVAIPTANAERNLTDSSAHPPPSDHT
jgi:FkbM family methyltransferase